MKSVLIQQVYDGLGFQPMLELTRNHHADYCKVHGFDYWPVIGNVFEHDPVLGSYAKIALIQKAMQDGYEFIVWLDADTLIVDLDTDLRDGIPVRGIGVCWHRIPQLHHWNVGALYIETTDKTKEFIKEWFAVYPPLKDGWNEQGVFNRMARDSKVVSTISDKWNATLDVSMVPDAVVLGFHGQGNAEQRYKIMKTTMEQLFPTKKADKVQGKHEVKND